MSAGGDVKQTVFPSSNDMIKHLLLHSMGKVALPANRGFREPQQFLPHVSQLLNHVSKNFCCKSNILHVLLNT
ncbi:hypothetical protein I3843_16G108700 [Carya illinoinensis]|nr:hypothetical protein I3843_16G108700 [Carya illinoinensis]